MLTTETENIVKTMSSVYNLIRHFLEIFVTSRKPRKLIN